MSRSRLGALLRRASFLPQAAALLLLLVSPAAATPIQIQRVVSDGGIEAWLVEDHSNPLMSIAVGFHGGSALDPAGKEGRAEMLTGLLDEGAGDLDSTAFQRKLADLSIELGFDSGADEFTGHMRTLTENRDEAFRLLGLALSQPRFDPDPVERMRQYYLSAASDRTEDPSAIAGKVWREVSFPDHPYGREGQGTVETLKAITADDLRDFVRTRFARDNLKVGVVGDITAAELKPLLDRTFGLLPATATPVDVPETSPTNSGQLLVVSKDVPQSVVLFGEAGVKRDDPDFFAAYLVNHVLGGGSFSSRLVNEVREKRGLAYSVDTFLSTLDHVGLVQGMVATQNARVAESIRIIREEWARMRDEGPTADELEAAKTFLTGSYALRFTSSGSTAEALVGIQLEGLPIDYVEKRNSYIEGVTLEDAKRVAKRLLDPAALTVVVVGTPEGVEPTASVPTGKSGG